MKVIYFFDTEGDEGYEIEMDWRPGDASFERIEIGANLNPLFISHVYVPNLKILIISRTEYLPDADKKAEIVAGAIA